MEMAADPFGIKEAELAVWKAFAGCGAFEEVLARQDERRAEKERGILRSRLLGAYNHAPRSLFICDTLHYFLGRVTAPTGEIHAALADWRVLSRSRDIYMTGRCHEFALAAYAHLGWPIVVAMCPEDGLPELAGRVIHVLVEAPDGRLLDVEGLKTQEEARPMIRSEPFRTIEVEELLSLVHTGGLSPLGDLSDARAALAAVLGMDVADIADPAELLPGSPTFSSPKR